MGVWGTVLFSAHPGLLYNLGKITSRPCATDLPSAKLGWLVTILWLSQWKWWILSWAIKNFDMLSESQLQYWFFSVSFPSQTSSWIFDYMFALITLQWTHRTIFLKLDSPTTLCSFVAKREKVLRFSSCLFISLRAPQPLSTVYLTYFHTFAVAGT